MKISVSYLSSVFDKKSTLNMIDNTSCDYLHVDLMDGRFVAKNNFNVKEVLSDLQDIKKPLDIHLMVEDPEKYIEELSTLNPATITFHIESSADIENTINLIKEKNIRVGIAIKPNTDISVLNDYIDKIDVVLVMTVEPGAGGQRFMFNMLDKVVALNKFKEENNLNYDIEVDGGVNEYTIIKSKLAGVTIAVCGSYICHHEDFENQVKNLRKITK